MALAAPFRPTGIGQVAAKNVFRITFSLALTTNPKLQAWDDENMNTTANKIFEGTTVNSSLNMIGGIGLTSAPGASWFPSSQAVAKAVDNAILLEGNTSYCLLSSSAPGDGGTVFFNIDYKFPSDLTPSDNMSHVVAVEYQYIGDAPVVTWAANSGTEGSPVWTALTTVAKGVAAGTDDTEIKPCDTGEGNNGTTNYKLTIPASGQAFADEIWMTNKA